MIISFQQESYSVFSPLFGPVIQLRHGYKPHSRHPTDLNPDKLVGGDNLDPEYVLSCRIRTGRSIRTYCLPPYCTRAERHAVEKIVTDAAATLDGPLKGKQF